MQAKALLAHRLIKVLCVDGENLSFILKVLKHIEEQAPINICSICGPMNIFANIFMKFAYPVIEKIPMDELSVKNFYKYFRRFEKDKKVVWNCD